MIELMISITTIIYMWMLSRKIKAGLYVGLGAQVLWVAYIIINQAWGLLPLNVALWFICITGILKWVDPEFAADEAAGYNLNYAAFILLWTFAAVLMISAMVFIIFKAAGVPI